MKNFFTFLIYKIYRFNIAQSKTVDPKFGFIMHLSIFELLHIVIISLLIKLIGINYKLPQIALGGVMLITLLASFNYLFYIKTNRIDKIHDRYQDKNLSVWKGNLLFFGYIMFLFIVMFVEVILYQKGLSKK